MTNPFSYVLIFLDNYTKHVVTYASFASFEIHNPDIILIRRQAFIAVPPKKRNHWQKYQIIDNVNFFR